MARVMEQIQRLSGNDLTVLITGESGTGKELVARAIHAGSHRSAGTFLPYNCTTTGRDLADSQLFGHRRGSFTGAVSDQPGLVRTAVGGTVPGRDRGPSPRRAAETAALPPGNTRSCRLARQPQRVDVRVLAATNADLEQRVAEGKFREDLYYRLSVIRIHVPPLRERREEIPHLSTFFLREAIERLGKPDIHLSSETLDVFSQYWWPGNVRQLKNEIQRAVALNAPGGASSRRTCRGWFLAPVARLGLDPRLPNTPNLASAIRTWNGTSSGGARPGGRNLGDGAVAGAHARGLC
jgi:DNA-binding NtrC family response regulator